MYKIDKKVPVPKHEYGIKYPFKKMEVGDSFFVPKDDVTDRNSIRQACYYMQRKMENAVKFRVVNEDNDTGFIGYRVFRVK
jgi:hypothetical protein